MNGVQCCRWANNLSLRARNKQPVDRSPEASLSSPEERQARSAQNFRRTYSLPGTALGGKQSLSKLSGSFLNLAVCVSSEVLSLCA